MTAINRPMDTLTGMERPAGNLNTKGGEALTGKGSGENDFDKLLSARQREGGGDPREPAKNGPVEKSTKVAAEKSGNEPDENGKPLPSARDKVTTGDDSEEKAITEKNGTITEIEQVLTGRSSAQTEVAGEDEAEQLTEQQGEHQAQQQAQAATVESDEVPLVLAETATAEVRVERVQKADGQAPLLPEAQQHSVPLPPGAVLVSGLTERKGNEEREVLTTTATAKKAATTMPELKGAERSDLQLSAGKELRQWLLEAKPFAAFDGRQLKAEGNLRVIDSEGSALAAARAAEGAAAASASLADSGAELGFSARLNPLSEAIRGGEVAAARAESMSFGVRVPVGSPDWGQVVAQRIAWLASNGIHAAELQLNPQELGPVEVRISVNNDQANIHFTSHHPAARDSLEASLQRLREMLENNGLTLVDVDISDRSTEEREQASSESREQGGVGTDEVSAEQEAQAALVTAVQKRSLVDYYA